MTPRPRIYVAGPLTSSGNVNENLDAAIRAARRLIAEGFAPFCPHLTFYLDPAGEYPLSLWMQIELPWLAAADAVLRLPGESDGADQEVGRADELGIPVFGTIADLMGHFAVVDAGNHGPGADSPRHSAGRYQTSREPVGTQQARRGGAVSTVGDV